MRRRIIAPIAVGVLAAFVGAPASASVDPLPSVFVDHTEWVRDSGVPGFPSLRVYPTPAGRAMAGQPGSAAAGDEAWREVLAGAPDADTPGMREQFLCHWQFVEFARPGKVSWNLEPWRPVVDDVTMLDSGCNPGGPEETF